MLYVDLYLGSIHPVDRFTLYIKQCYRENYDVDQVKLYSIYIEAQVISHTFMPQFDLCFAASNITYRFIIAIFVSLYIVMHFEALTRLVYLDEKTEKYIF